LVSIVRLSRVHFPVTTLGPGRRVGFWLQGCSIRCPGCISLDTWPATGTAIAVDDCVAQVTPWLEAADGVTISGGEPFDQVEGLRALLGRLRAWPKLDVLVYSGYSMAALAAKLAELDGLIDTLVSDPYLEDAPQTLALRGSDNQRMHLLTELGRLRFSRLQHATRSGEQFDVMVDLDGSAWLAGIPSRTAWQRLQATLAGRLHAWHVSGGLATERDR
jgi:anaerobic ribonucleoside-triphosphate reductase activating protein